MQEKKLFDKVKSKFETIFRLNKTELKFVFFLICGGFPPRCTH